MRDNALLVIDMQRDFLDPAGYVAQTGVDVALLRDKPGFGAFYATDLELILRTAGVSALSIAGVTTDICVHSTLREAVNRGFDCTVIEDACAAADPATHRAMLDCIVGEGGILGRVMNSEQALQAWGLPGALLPNASPP
jgi:nicotinamidase-related amidase